jgi:uncharacterized membrane protein
VTPGSSESNIGPGERASKRHETRIAMPTFFPLEAVNIPGHEDVVRKRLAYALVILLASIVFVGFGIFIAGAILDWPNRDFRSLIQLFFTSVLTLVSTVIGFYFGSEHRRPRHHSGDDA